MPPDRQRQPQQQPTQASSSNQRSSTPQHELVATYELASVGWRLAAVFACLVTLGAPLVASVYYPIITIWLWHRKCPVEKATTLLVKWTEDGADNYVVSHVATHKYARSKSGAAIEEGVVQMAIAQGHRYLWSHGSLRVLPDMDNIVEAQLLGAAQSLSCKLAPQALSSSDRTLLSKVYGVNTSPTTHTHWAIQLLVSLIHPMYLFQFFASGLWIYYKYYEYSFVVAIITIVSVSANVVISQRQAIRFKRAAQTDGDVYVLVDYAPPVHADTEDTSNPPQDTGEWRSVCIPDSERASNTMKILQPEPGTLHMKNSLDYSLPFPPTGQVSVTDNALAVVDAVSPTRMLDAMVPERAPEMGLAWVRKMSVQELVVGDIVLLEQADCPADMVLLQGECVVDESAITGENVPLHRTGMPLPLPDNFQTSNLPPASKLLAGTRILATSSTNKRPCLAMVTHTGYQSIKGRLVRSMLHSQAQLPTMQGQAMLLVLVMMTVGLGFYAYDIVVFKRLGLLALDIGLLACDIVTISVPPAMIVCTVLVSTLMLIRLRRNEVMVEDLRRAPLAGVVDVVCLDKTGTITEPEANFLHILPCVDAETGSHINDCQQAPMEFRVLFAACHGLVLLGDSIKGHPLDLAMYHAGGWKMGHEGMALDLREEDGIDAHENPMFGGKEDPEITIETAGSDFFGVGVDEAPHKMGMKVPAAPSFGSRFGRAGDAFINVLRRISTNSMSNPTLNQDASTNSQVTRAVTAVDPYKKMSTGEHMPSCPEVDLSAEGVILEMGNISRKAPIIPNSKIGGSRSPTTFSTQSPYVGETDNSEPARSTQIYSTPNLNLDTSAVSMLPIQQAVASCPGGPRKSIHMFAEAHMEFVQREHLLGPGMALTGGVVSGGHARNVYQQGSMSPTSNPHGGPAQLVSPALLATRNAGSMMRGRSDSLNEGTYDFLQRGASNVNDWGGPAPVPSRPTSGTAIADPLMAMMSDRMQGALAPFMHNSPIGGGRQASIRGKHPSNLVAGSGLSRTTGSPTKKSAPLLDRILSSVRSLSGGGGSRNSSSEDLTGSVRANVLPPAARAPSVLGMSASMTRPGMSTAPQMMISEPPRPVEPRRPLQVRLPEMDFARQSEPAQPGLQSSLSTGNQSASPKRVGSGHLAGLQGPNAQSARQMLTMQHSDSLSATSSATHTHTPGSLGVRQANLKPQASIQDKSTYRPVAGWDVVPQGSSNEKLPTLNPAALSLAGTMDSILHDDIPNTMGIRMTGSQSMASHTTSIMVHNRQTSMAPSSRMNGASPRTGLPPIAQGGTIKNTRLWVHPGRKMPEHMKYNVVLRFPFTSLDQRCSAVVQHPSGELVLYMKGAPERIAELCDPKTLPHNFTAMLQAESQPGRIVLAAAQKYLDPGMLAEHLSLYGRQRIEAGAEFIGFVSLTNTLRASSKEVIQDIQSVGMRAVMVTGDSMRSAVQVAGQVGMLPDQAVIMVEVKPADPNDPRGHGGASAPAARQYPSRCGNQLDMGTELMVAGDLLAGARGDMNGLGHAGSWIDSRLTFRVVHGCDSHILEPAHAFRLLNKQRPGYSTLGCAINGAAFGILVSEVTQAPLLRLILKNAAVFARMLPDHKRQLVVLLGHPPPSSMTFAERCLAFGSLTHKIDIETGGNSKPGAQDMIYQQRNIAFCGDGANDMAALRVAPVGVSLTGQAGSLAAPISISHAQGLAGLRTLLLEGRNIASNLTIIFQFVMVYAFVQMLCITTLYTVGLILCQYQYLLQDLFYCTITAVGMGLTKPSKRLNREFCSLTLFSLRVLAPVIIQWGIMSGGLLGTLHMMKREPWFKALPAPLEVVYPPPPPSPPTAPPGMFYPPAPANDDYFADYIPIVDEDYSITRPESGVTNLVGLTIIFGSGLAFNLCSKSARQKALSNKVLIVIWIVQVVFLQYFIFAPGDKFKRYGPRGPGIVDLPSHFRVQLGCMCLGLVGCQLVGHAACLWVIHWWYGH